MRPLKTPEELILEGYNAEGALVFLKDFLESEKEKLLKEMINSPDDKLHERRAVYKYLCSIESALENKLITGINYAAEQFAPKAELDEED